MAQSSNTRLLLINCRDQTGLIHKVTGALFRRGCNIMSNREFVEHETGSFFMRTAFESGDEEHGLLDEVKALLPSGSRVRLASTGRKRIVVLVTREPHCLGDLLIRAAFQDMPADIVAVIGNRPQLRKLTESFGRPFHEVSHKGITREEHEEQVVALLDRYAPDYVVLAKYMRVLTEAFVSSYANRMLNIHHSFLPAFAGAKPYRQAYNRGVKIIGATAHFVTPELDQGPIIAQDVLAVDHRQSPREMAAAGRDVEKIVLARALRWVLEDRVFVSGNKTVIFD